VLVHSSAPFPVGSEPEAAFLRLAAHPAGQCGFAEPTANEIKVFLYGVNALAADYRHNLVIRQHVMVWESCVDNLKI
jgi:hypothetical protein